MFPSLSAVVSRNDLEFLNALEASEHAIANAAGIVASKIKAEEMQVALDGKVFGSAFFFLSSSKSLEWCEKNFECSREKILEGARAIAPIIEAREDKLKEIGVEKSERGKRFSELVGNAGLEGKQE